MQSTKERVNSNKGIDWTRLLGENVVRTMDEGRNKELYQKVVRQKETQLDALYRLFDSVAESTVWKEVPMEFPAFYGWFFSVSLSYAETHFPGLFATCEDARSVILRNVYEAVKMIPIRCLIQEIHHCKEEGKLKGAVPQKEKLSDAISQDEKLRDATPKEEYQFYDKHMLGNIIYVRELCQAYPELLRLMLLTVDWTMQELAHIVEAVEADREEIRKIFCADIPFFKIHKMTCALSDTHREGKTVAEVELDNGVRIFYKPRSLQKESEYQSAYEWFGRKLEIETYCMRRICRKDYGWEERIERKECDSEAAVGRYFYRLGMQLCLCYLVNGADLHGENIMAKGEFPIIIDMETFSGNRRQGREDMGEDVLRTGILPVPVWGGQSSAGGASVKGALSGSGLERCMSAGGVAAGGVNVSALHKEGKIIAPFRLPTIEHAGTSDIAVAYRQGELEALESLWRSESRYVTRHTQQYSMYLFTSLHPDFMRSTEDRIRFLHVLRKAGAGGEADYKGGEKFWQELRDMVNMDIPYFSCKGDSLSLFASDGTEIPRFFVASAFEEGKRKFKRLGEADLQKQIMLISYSLLMLGEGRDSHKEGLVKTVSMDKKSDAVCIRKMWPVTEEQRLAAVRGIVQTIYRLRLDGSDKERGKDAVWGQDRDVGANMACGTFWPDLQFYGDGAWGIRPLSMDLYDGLPGVALFFATLSEKMPDMSEREDYKQMFSQLCGQMFAYTLTDSESPLARSAFDAVCPDGYTLTDAKRPPTPKGYALRGTLGYTDSRERAENAKSMGLFVGESSLWYAYLLLWESKKDPKFLKYAVRQECIVRKRRSMTNEVDLLAGDAGCILCYLKMYECSEKGEGISRSGTAHLVHMEMPDRQKYLARAVEIGEVLWERVEEQTVGCGWTVQGEDVPLAGMAHGNSGVICAYAGLLEWTRNPIYVERIRKLVEYEDSLYSYTLGNWRDVRKQHAEGREKRNMVAWCHGAAGILLSRLKLRSLPEFQNDAYVKQDIERVVAALKYGEIPDNICLCHGLAGNYLIIRRYLELFPDKELEERGEMLLSMLISQLEEDEYMAAQERNRVGLAGAGLALV